CLLLSESAGLDDEDGGGGGSCKDPKVPGALEALGEGGGGGGGGGGDSEGVLGESDLLRCFLRASARSA
ncbi:hypothetical protein Tco_0443980, partial [Tanacetum coccineum]